MQTQKILKNITALALILSIVPAYAATPNDPASASLTTGGDTPHLANQTLDGSFTPASPEDGDGDDVSYVYNWYQSRTSGSGFGQSATNVFIDDANLVNYLPMNDDALDYAGTFDGTVDGATLTTGDGGMIDEAYSFDGVNDSISFGSSEAIDTLFNGQNQFTFAAWYYLDDTSTYRTFFTKGDVGAGSDYSGSIGFIYDSYHGKYIFTIYDNDSDTTSHDKDYLASWSSGSFPTGEWAHIAITYNPNTVSAEAYVNGNLVAGKTIIDQGATAYDASTPITQNADDDLYIGDKFLTGNSPYSGKFDEVQFYDRVLDASSVEKLYYGGSLAGEDLASDITSPGDYWKLGVKGCDTSGCSAETFATEILISGISTGTSPGPFMTAHTSGNPIGRMSVSNPSTTVGLMHKGLILDLPCKSKYYNATTSRIDDRTPYRNHGTNNGAILSNTYVTFDGSSQYIQVPNLDRTTFTFATWVKRDGNPVTDEGILVSSVFDGWGIYFKTSDQIGFGKIGDSEVYSDTAITDTLWHHIILTYDGSTVKYYIDGAADGTDSYSKTFDSSGANYTLGSQGAAVYLDGDMSGVKLYDRVFTAADVKRLYEKGR